MTTAPPAPQLLRFSAGNHVEEATWLGFDLDHALARYRVGPLVEHIFECLRSAIIDEAKAFPVEALEGPYDPSLIRKGVIADFHTGDLVFLTEDGKVSTAWHGNKCLSEEEIVAKYGSGEWPGTPILRKQGKHDSFFNLLTYFDLPCVPIFSRLVDWVDSREGASSSSPASLVLEPGQSYDAVSIPTRYGHVKNTIIDAFNYIFDNQYAWDRAFFKPIRENPHLFLYKRRRLAKRLVHCREKLGKRVLLVTNSHIHFGVFTLNYCFGSDWRKCFDLVCFNGLKPAFFTKHTIPFRQVEWASGEDGQALDSVSLPVFPTSSPSAFASPAFVCQGCAFPVQLLADALLHAAAASDLNADAEAVIRFTHVRAGEWKQGGPAATSSHGGSCKATTTPVVGSELLSVTIQRRGLGGAVIATDSETRVNEASSPSASASVAALPPQTLSLTDALQTPFSPNSVPASATPGTTSPALSTDLYWHRETGHAGSGAAEGRKARFLYFGDHLHGDVVAAATAALSPDELKHHRSHLAALDGSRGWPAVAVAEEMEVSSPGAAALAKIAANGGGFEALARLPAHLLTAEEDNEEREEEAKMLADHPAFQKLGAGIGSFFVCCKPSCPRSTSAGGGDPVCGPHCGKRSWFCALMEKHSVLAVNDIEPALEALLPSGLVE